MQVLTSASRNDILLALDEETAKELRDVLCEGVPDCRETLSKVSVTALPQEFLFTPATCSNGKLSRDVYT